MSLHILNSPSSLNRCLFSLSDDDDIVLIEDAVALAASDLNLAQRNVRIAALQDDLARRGITPTSAVTSLDYSGFVALCTQHRHCLSW